MSQPRHFILRDRTVRERCAEFVLQGAGDDWDVMVTPPKMNNGQKRRMRAICGDIARARLEFAGKVRSAQEWYVLLISGHAAATGEEVELVRGLEGELVNIRESSSSMSRRRGASLIEYATAFATNNGVRLRDPRYVDE